jgi:hypothetical protein
MKPTAALLQEALKTNPNISVATNGKRLPEAEGWVTQNTAILIVHGIGDQNPLETIDQFGRTLAETFQKKYTDGTSIKITHRLAKKSDSSGGHWFDNFIRLQRVTDGIPAGPWLDIYEYYWANKTEDEAELTDIQKWVSGVTAGARTYYKENEALGVRFKDNSKFFKDGRFRPVKYWMFVHFTLAFIPAMVLFYGYLLKALAYIPVVGIPFRMLYETYSKSYVKKITNVIGDIVVYNSTDEKCRFYAIRKEILEGAVKALRFLVEEGSNGRKPYEKVILAGHSLGSQIAYDAMNRLVHLAYSGELGGYAETNSATLGKQLMDVLGGFITFGSPLDKIAFFLRNQVPPEQYIRRQLMRNFHAFKQRNWDVLEKDYPFIVDTIFPRLLDDLKWRNYFDKRDYVSGSLDYYSPLTNIDMKFESGTFSFTHSRYWQHRGMFDDIIHEFLLGTNVPAAGRV